MSMEHSPTSIFVAMILVIVACGETSTGDPTSSTAAPVASTTTSTTTAPSTTSASTSTTVDESSACDLATPDMVEMAYGGDVDKGIEGYADNCTYWIDGADLAVTKIDVFDLGPADGWDQLVEKQTADWGGVIDVDGIGQAAFHPTYHEGRDLFFRTEDRIYSIISFGGVEGESLERVTEAVLSLAAAILDHSS